jgi:hypothetical protein
MLTGTESVLATFGFDVMFACQCNKTVDSCFGNKDYTAAVTSVASIWTTTRYIFFAPEADAAVAASSAGDFNVDSVNKHGKLAVLASVKCEV